MPNFNLYTDDLEPKPADVGIGFKVPENLKETDPRFENPDIKLGFADYMRLSYRYIINRFAGVMGMETSDSQPITWVEIIAQAVSLLIKIIKKLAGK